MKMKIFLLVVNQNKVKKIGINQWKLLLIESLKYKDIIKRKRQI